MIIDREKIKKNDIISKISGIKYSSYQDIKNFCNIKNFNVRYEEISSQSKASAPHRHTKVEEFYIVVSGEITVYEGATKNIAKAGEMVYFSLDSILLHYIANESSQPAHMISFCNINSEDQVLYH